MDVPLLAIPERRWECPNCDLKQVTRIAEEHSRFHECKGLKGLTVPMVPLGTKCKTEAIEREDYINGETVTFDADGRPIMRVEVTREDGNDIAVYAPCAGLSGEALS